MKKTKQHVLVTGGAGYIGAVLVPYLLHFGYDVTLFDKFYFGREPIQDFIKSIRVIQGDVRNPPSNLFRGINSVIHLAALSNDPTAEFNPVANMQINRDGTIKIATLAKQAGVERFIFASSCSIYDKGNSGDENIQRENNNVNPKNPYSLSKFLAERALLGMSTNRFVVTILRKGTVYGFSPRMRYDLIINAMVRDALKQKQITVFSKGLQWRPLVSIEDVVEAYRCVLSSPASLINGQIFNIAENNYRVKDVADEIVSLFKKRYDISIKKKFMQDDKADRSYKVSITKANRLLGYSPKKHIIDAVPLLIKSIQMKKKYMNYSLPVYYNIQWMKPILERMK